MSLDTKENKVVMVGQKFPKVAKVSNVYNLARTARNEFLISCRSSMPNTKLVFGIGIVGEIIKGDEFDLVYINFGSAFNEKFYRKVIVADINARKQLSLLKKNQFTQVYGTTKTNNENGKFYNYIYAKVFWNSYTPLAYDRKILEKENKDQYKKIDNTDIEYQAGLDFLSIFKNNE